MKDIKFGFLFFLSLPRGEFHIFRNLTQWTQNPPCRTFSMKGCSSHADGFC